MRIAVCGPSRSDVISQVENSLKIQAKKPWPTVNGNPMIVDYAAETYKYENEMYVVFDGSPFDFLAKSEGAGYDDVYEQIAIDSLNNVDYIAVITLNMDRDTLKMYKEYANLFPDKIRFFTAYTDFELSLT